MIERATHFATHGNLEQAKCAATILSRGPSRRKACAALVEVSVVVLLSSTVKC